ncbi:MAG: response regulator [Solibacillus sp.]
MTKEVIDFREIVEDYEQLRNLYELQRAYVMRKKINFSIVALKYVGQQQGSYEAYYAVVKRQLRTSDFVYKHVEKHCVILLLSITRVVEVKSFLTRLKKTLGKEIEPVIASVAEVANAKHELATVLECAIDGLKHATAEQPYFMPYFLDREKETVKVSILENDIVTLSIFKNMIQNLEVKNIELQVEVFQDGLQFMQSDRYVSGHHHILLVNDILPKKNGLEVLQFLRAQPNERKYYVLFISNRLSEESLLNAMENGADAYFVRPFNLHVLETQIKNYLRRLH